VFFSPAELKPPFPVKNTETGSWFNSDHGMMGRFFTEEAGPVGESSLKSRLRD
jgi:hypothetical protein